MGKNIDVGLIIFLHLITKKKKKLIFDKKLNDSISIT